MTGTASGKKVDAVLQARLASTRLPGKLLLPILGKPLLQHVVERIRTAKTIDRIIIATTTNPGDDPICDLAARLDVPAYRGSEQDVLDRYYRTAKQFHIRDIARLTPDDACKDPGIVDLVVGVYLDAAGSLDYVSNNMKPTFPDGVDVEVFSFAALERAWREARLPSEREHVTPFIWKNPALFRLQNVESPVDLAHHHWTVDRENDFILVSEIYKRLYRPGDVFLMKDILALLEREPSLLDITKDAVRMEGYYKSLREDKDFLEKGNH